MVGLFGEGYVEVAAVDLEVASSITLSFRTQQSDALIVLAQSPDEQVSTPSLRHPYANCRFDIAENVCLNKHRKKMFHTFF